MEEDKSSLTTEKGGLTTEKGGLATPQESFNEQSFKTSSISLLSQ